MVIASAIFILCPRGWYGAGRGEMLVILDEVHLLSHQSALCPLLRCLLLFLFFIFVFLANKFPRFTNFSSSFYWYHVGLVRMHCVIFPVSDTHKTLFILLSSKRTFANILCLFNLYLCYTILKFPFAIILGQRKVYFELYTFPLNKTENLKKKKI